MTDILSSVETPKRELYDFEEELLSNLSGSTPFSSYGSSSSPESTSFATPEPMIEGQTEESTEKSAEKPADKPVKKRKSWGQELPTPTTNLPPRKRAKTEAEKEQRRIERVLRNRAAAQSSRERKRKEVEALEDVKNKLAEENTVLHKTNKDLNARLELVLGQYQALQLEIRRMKEQWEKTHGVPFKSEDPSTPSSHILLTPSSISHDSFSVTPSEIASPSSTDGTLDPSALSTPCKLDNDPFSMTQHTAVMLCPRDLPCQLTGPSFQVLAMLTIMRWTLCLVSAISQGPLSELVMYMTINQQIPDTELPKFFPLIRLLASLTTTRHLVCRLRTLSPTLALLMDATGSVRWFESTANELELSKWSATLDDDGKDLDPARACRRFVMALGGMGGADQESKGGPDGRAYGTDVIGRMAEKLSGQDGFDFKRVLSSLGMEAVYDSLEV